MGKPNNYKNFDNNYKESIKHSVKNGNFFRDGFNWFSNLYLRPIVDRTFFIFMSIIGVIIVYNIIAIITMILPLKENIFIPIKEKDLTKYRTKIYNASQNKDTKSTDEDILKYLLIGYVKERESHNYKSANINDINKKLENIKNSSSRDIFNQFNFIMSSSNKNGPFYYFGKNVETTVKINDFNFIRIHRKKFLDKIKDFFNVDLIPIKAEVYYTLKTQIGNKITNEKRKAVISFNFTGVEFNKKTKEYSQVKLLVTNYKNYKLK